MCRNNPQLTLANHLCCLTSLAPELEPTRLCSSLMSNLRIADLHRLDAISIRKPPRDTVTHLVTGLDSGKVTSFFRTFANVAFRLGPLKGVVANYTSSASRRNAMGATYNHLVDEDTKRPPVDSGSMSAALDHLWRDIFYDPSTSFFEPTAGNTPSVPTNEFVRKSAMHDRVSTRNIYIPTVRPIHPDLIGQLTPLEPLCFIPAGAPPGSPDCLDRSKSDNMICPL